MELIKFANIGMKNPFVSRIIELTTLKNGVCSSNKQVVQNKIISCLFEGLFPAYESLQDFIELDKQQDAPIMSKHKRANDVISYLYIAFKDRLQAATEALGYDIGFLFQKDEPFQRGAIEFLTLHPRINKEFLNFLKDIRISWWFHLKEIRDVTQVHSKGKEAQRIKKAKDRLTKENLQNLFDNCWLAIEDILAVLIDDLMEDKYQMRLLQIKNFQSRTDDLKRFRWFDVSDQ